MKSQLLGRASSEDNSIRYHVKQLRDHGEVKNRQRPMACHSTLDPSGFGSTQGGVDLDQSLHRVEDVRNLISR